MYPHVEKEFVTKCEDNIYDTSHPKSAELVAFYPPDVDFCYVHKLLEVLWLISVHGQNSALALF